MHLKRATAIVLSTVLCAVAFCTNCGGEKHSLVFVEAKAPTCTDEGNIAHWLCTVCGERFADEAAKESISVDLPALDHNYERVETAATCLEEGKVEKVCSRCGDAILLETLSAAGHDFGEYTVSSPAKCYEPGVERRTCKNCPAYEERPIPEIGHHTFDRENLCTVCGIRANGTEGLGYSLIVEHGREIGYSVGLGSAETDAVVIPCYHETLPVVRIEKDAFRESGIRQIACYADLTEIEEGAFRDCADLEEIAFPRTLLGIGYAAFRGCARLRSVELPDSVTTVGAEAFYGCSAVTRLSLGKDLSEIGRSAFWNMGKLNSIEVSAGNEHFSGEGNCLIERETNKLLLGSNKSVIPEGVTELGENAFLGCGTLRSIAIPRSVTKIGDFCFRDCVRLAEIRFGGTEEEWRNVEKGEQWDLYTADLKIVFSK